MFAPSPLPPIVFIGPPARGEGGEGGGVANVNDGKKCGILNQFLFHVQGLLLCK